MRILWLICSLAVVVTTFGQTPVVTSSEPGWDFGVREQGVSDVKKIAIKNEGDADLVISAIKVTCGCVKGEMVSKTIKPGESSDLVLKLNTSGQIGKIRKFAYVMSNDPKTPNLILHVNGEVRGKWDLSTVNVVFRAEAGEAQEQTVKLTIREGERVVLKRIFIKSSHLEVDTAERRAEVSGEKAAPGKLLGYDLKVKLLPNCPPGSIAGVLRIETNDNQIPFRNVAVHARVSGVAQVKPSRLYVGRIFQGKRKTVNMKVTRSDGEPFRITGVSSDLDYVKVHVLPLREGHEYDVLVTVAPALGTVEMVGHVKIETDIKGSEVMTVDLEGRAAPPR